jgi:hypothetical protein
MFVFVASVTLDPFADMQLVVFSEYIPVVFAVVEIDGARGSVPGAMYL